MKLKSVTIENYRAIENLVLPLDPTLTVLHGANGHGKTSVLSAIAVGLVGAVNFLGPHLHKSNIDFSEEDWRDRCRVNGWNHTGTGRGRSDR